MAVCSAIAARNTPEVCLLFDKNNQGTCCPAVAFVYCSILILNFNSKTLTHMCSIYFVYTIGTASVQYNNHPSTAVD